MRNNQFLGLHIVFWILNIVGTIVIPHVLFDRDHFVLTLTFFVSTLVCFYVNYFFVVPFFFDIRKLYKSLIGFFVSVLSFVLIRYFLEETLLPLFIGRGNYAPGTHFMYYFFDNIYYSSTTIFISTVFSLIQKFLRLEDERLQLLSEKKNAEIQALKTQINPHFIFNSLNNIYSLVFQKSERALPAIEELGTLLRYSTKDLEKDYIPLKRELGYISSLMELEKLRIHQPEKVILRTDFQNADVQISPMLLVPFVENAFKHGDLKGFGVDVLVQEKGNNLHFRIENEIRKGAKDQSSGIGIANVKKRLELIYPNKHLLRISDRGGRFVVDLTISL